MFTGLVQSVGVIADLKLSQKGGVLVVKPKRALSALRLGESVAVDGCCLTVTKLGKTLVFDVSPETIAKTAIGNYRIGQTVNLERALKASDRLGGHFVLGHVDGVGKIESLDKKETVKNPTWVFRFKIPQALSPYLIEKGSVALNGISLTVCGLKKNSFSVHVVPHTLAHTNLLLAKAGDKVNVETDVLGKYVQRLIRVQN